MEPRRGQMPLHLRAGEVLRIPRGKGLAVRSVGGTLWITQDGDTADIVLESDQSVVLDRPGLALVSAPVGPATVVVETTSRDARRTRKGLARNRFRWAA
jgi:hypothetical protein